MTEQRSKMACLGAATRQVRTTEHMERCQACGTEIQFQLVYHSVWGFKAGCERYNSLVKPCACQQAGVTPCVQFPDCAHGEGTFR